MELKSCQGKLIRADIQRNTVTIEVKRIENQIIGNSNIEYIDLKGTILGQDMNLNLYMEL